MKKRSLAIIDAPTTRRAALRVGVTSMAAVAAGCAAGAEALDAALDSTTDAIDASSVDTSTFSDAPRDQQTSREVSNVGNYPPRSISVGATSDFTLNEPRLFQDVFFVVLDSLGFYAISSNCTHMGCTINPMGSGFRCPCHGARYDADGAVLSGPAPRPLEHYAMCVLSNGHLAVAFGDVVSPETRLVV
jgi:Rieske Fe-S protein